MLPNLELSQLSYNHIKVQIDDQISANSRLFTQAELRLSSLLRECTAVKNTLTEYEFLILESKHLTNIFTDHEPIIFLFRQKSNPNHSVYIYFNIF